jgi:hypothetical protein
MSDVENDLRARVDAFVGDLTALIRRQALAAVEDLLHGEGGRRPAPGRATSAVVVRSASGRGPGRPIATHKRKAGEKRSPQELQRITDQLYGYIKSNGGQGVEQIAKALSTPTKELTLPIRKLLKDKKIGSKGQKRATRYYPR